jgi:hypothetical protein
MDCIWPKQLHGADCKQHYYGDEDDPSKDLHLMSLYGCLIVEHHGSLLINGTSPMCDYPRLPSVRQRTAGHGQLGQDKALRLA